MPYKIHVLQVLGTLDYGGIESMIMNLYRNIDRNKIQFDFVVHSKQHGVFYDEVLALGGHVYFCPRYSGTNAIQYRSWWRSFFRKHSEFKILHSHLRSSASLFIPIAKKNGLVTIVHSHSTFDGKGFCAYGKRIMEFPLRSQADYLVACSAEAGKWLFGRDAFERSNYIFLPNGIDAARFALNQETRSRYRKELGINGKLVFGHVGRFNEAKNHLFLLDVFAEIHKRNPDTILLLVGNGQLEKDIRRKSISLGLGSSVNMMGNRSDVADILQAMDVFLFPSKWEGLPMALVEAQAAGLPYIISDKITRDVDITQLVHRLPINDVKPWADLALSGLPRSEVTDKIVKAGFDVKESAIVLARIYEEILEGK